ncbi:unnamed protein product [Cercopithifilaria johnstoni]|uniref:Papilin n=1 Tax=Cercopithifilaria johnstoni TaxID=2874296 RepID=A0A8J2MRH5_9BILA|nr:unnamed protein product [Cercopithifilaria johnstoni]
MKALLALVVFVILFCITAVATKTDSVNPCKRQPFRGRCPFTKGKSPTRSQFVLRYYLRDKECVSYPFGHCADDENEPILYRYKEECEKACLNESNNSDTATENAHMIEKSTSSLSNKITDSDTDIGTSTEKQVSTTSEPFFENTHTISSQRAAFAVQKDTPHKLLTECERRRQASESGLIKSDFIPICTADGSFRPLQCVTKGEKCFCVDHNGIKIPNSEFNGTMKPNCKQIIKVQKPLINECLSAVDSGPCSAAFARWYYDDSEQQCVQFEYSGCGGNGNNYLTRVECEKQCKPAAYNKAKCKDGLEPLRNESGQLVNCKESACPDGYLCSIAQLGSTCCPISTSSNVASDICQLPKERGPCDQFELRFYYNNRLDECKYFFFGGCEGNANNFERVEECERICRQRGAKVSAVSIVSAPQLITSGPQMRKLSKEFGTKTVKKTKSEENELVELISSVTSDRDDNISSISDVIENIDADASTNEAISEITEIDTSSATVPHDRPTTSKDLSATNTDQSKLHLSQKINEDVHKSRQKETKTPLNSSNIDIITDFTTLEHETTISTFDNSEKFIASNNESNRNAKISNESVAVTGQQLSNRKQVKMFSSTSEITTTRHPSTTTGREERLSNKSKPSSTTPPSTTPSSTTPPSTTPSSTTPSSTSSISLSSSTTVTSRLTTSSATESSVPQPTESSDRCFQKLDRGTCTGQFLRWHWDSERNTCQVFTYSGCGGNGNNFRNREDCFAACHKPPQPISNIGNVCEHSIHPGDCTGVFQRFAFDSTIGDCRPFTYTGCGGNGNNFGSSLECRNKCTTHRPTLSTNICEHPIEVGECSGVFPRFAYDLAANECRPFTYGGCGGNGNNFGSIAECKETCIQGQPNVSVQCPAVDVSLCVEPCILFSNRRGCHECTCPVAHSASTSSATTSGTSPIDESKALEAEQFIQNKVQKKDESTAHPEKISPTNSVAELGEKCSQPMDAGPCKNFIERWFFDIESGLCQSFQYGGCAGNRNHFFSKYECEIHCARFFNRRTGRRRIVAYQNALHARHDTIEQLQSAEILNESEYEDITDNQESPAYRSSLNDLPSPMKANSWKHVAESDPENGRYAGVKLEGDTELNGLHSLQHGSGIAMQNEHLDAMISQNFAKSSAREQQPWSVSLEHKVDILVPDSNTQHQTIVDDDKQISTEATKQQDVHRQQIDDKTVFSKVQNDASQMISNASKSEIIPVQKVKMDTHMKSTCKDVSTSMNLSEWNRENSALQQNQSQSTTQKINVLQIQQQNGLLQQILPQQQILRHDTQYEKIENITSLISNLLDSQIANQTFIDYTTTQNSKTSSDEQITGMITNDREKELKKRIENTIINKALISNSIFDNLVSDGYKIPIDQNGGRLISDEIATSMNSFSPRFEAKNEIHMQVNSVNEPLKKHNRSAEVTNGSSSRKISSQFINTQLPHKEYDNAVTVAKDTVLRQSNRDSVLRHHVRIINRGSVLQAFSSLSPLSSNSPPLLLTSSLPTLSPTISSPSSSTTPPLILSSSTSLLSSSLSSPLIPSEAHLNIFEEMSHRSIPDKNESFNGELIALKYSTFI